MVRGMSISCSLPLRSLRVEGADDDVLVVGGEPFSVGDEADTNQRYAALEAWTRQHFPVSEVVARWSSMDYFSADHLPYIGYLYRGTNSLFTATGFSKWGLTNGMAAALIIRDLLDGRENPWHALVDARRWDVLHAVTGMARETVHTVKHFVGDKVGVLTAPDITELKQGEGAVVKCKGETVRAYRDPTGSYHVVRPICTHLGCHLVFNQGDKVWDCPCHGSQFAVDGEVLHGPACKNLEKLNLSW